MFYLDSPAPPPLGVSSSCATPSFVSDLSLSERLKNAEKEIDEEEIEHNRENRRQRSENSLMDDHQTDQDQDQDDTEEEDNQEFSLHISAMERFRKTLYYGGVSVDDMPTSDRFSLPVTEICVDAFRSKGKNANGYDCLDRLDLARASHLTKSTCASPTSLVLALLYLDRLRKQNPTYLRSVSSTGLFLVSLMVASKYLQDDGEDDEVFNDEWASAGGMEKKDINQREMEFLAAIDWRLYVSDEEYESMKTRLEVEVATRQVAKRGGWLTYTDFLVLVNERLKIWKIIMDCSINVTLVCATAYCVSVLSMVGTIFLLNKTPLGPSSVQSVIRSLTAQRTTTTPSSEPQVASEWEHLRLVETVTSDLTSIEDEEGVPASLTNSSSSMEAQWTKKEIYLNEQVEDQNELWKTKTDPYELDPGEVLHDLATAPPPTNLQHHSTSVFLSPNQKTDFPSEDKFDVVRLIHLLRTWTHDPEVQHNAGKLQCPWTKSAFLMNADSLLIGNGL